MAEDDVDVLLRSSSIGNNNEESILFFRRRVVNQNVSSAICSNLDAAGVIKKLLSIPAVQAIMFTSEPAFVLARGVVHSAREKRLYHEAGVF
jgi:hypothetical protein